MLIVSRLQIDCDALRGQPTIIVREVFKFAWRQAGWPEQSMGFDEWQQLAVSCDRETAQTVQFAGRHSGTTR